MELKARINEDLKEAMRQQDALQRTVLRGLLNAFKEAEQSRREDLVKRALKKHNVNRPAGTTAEALAAYDSAMAAALSAEKVEANAVLDEAEMLAVLQRVVKQRQDSIDEAQKGGRQDIATAEQAELTILQGYLPAQLSREDVELEAKTLIAQVGAQGAKDMGKVMGPLMSKLKGQADGKVISDVVKSLLAG